MIFPVKTRHIRDCIAVCDHRGEAKKGRVPKVTFEGEVWVARRLSYCLNVGVIPRGPADPSGPLVLFHCDNPWCIAPEHLYLGNKSDAASRRGLSEDTKAKISASNRGKKRSDETRAKMSAAHVGKTKSKETRERMSAAAKRRSARITKEYPKATLKDILDACASEHNC